jgi:hypothetical protein
MSAGYNQGVGRQHIIAAKISGDVAAVKVRDPGLANKTDNRIEIANIPVRGCAEGLALPGREGPALRD